MTPKIQTIHLEKLAYIYIRQSSMGQVRHHQESTERQYALKQRAVALGWRLDDIVVVASRSHLTQEVEAFVEALRAEGKTVEFHSSGSSLKLCLVAEGAASVYPRLGPTMEWDTAAAHAVVIEAGKKVLEYEDRQPLRYNKENLLNPWFIVE